MNNGKRLKIVLVGGGSTWTPGLLKSLCIKKEEFPIEELRMFDIDEERQRRIGEFAEILFREDYPEAKIIYTTNKEEAYKDVDFVFCQIRSGGFDMRQYDERIPLSYGVVGQETCGPGGFAYGLRSIPDMIEIINDARKYAGDTWILNYTNPAAIVALALDRVFPDDKKIINMCDQPVNLINSFAKILDVAPSEIIPEYIGLNHFGWFTKLSDRQGKDLLPELRENILDKGFAPSDAAERDASWLVTYGMVKRMVSDFPEYIPNTYLQYYLYPEKVVEHLDANYTRTDEVKAGREKRVFEECAKVKKEGSAKGSLIAKNEAHADMIVDVASSIFYDKNQEFILIVKNDGIIDNFSKDAMVECRAKVGRDGVKGYRFGNLDVFMKGLMEGQLAYESLTVDAYFEKSYEKALQALTMNRTVVDAGKAKAILDDLLDINKGKWPELK